MTEDELKATVLADYAALEGRVVLASELKIFVGDDHDVLDLGDEAALVRVNRGQSGSLGDYVVQRGDEEWADPEYSATLLEPHPRIPEGSSVYLEARSRSLHGRADPSDRPRCTLADDAVAARFPEAAPEPEVDEGYAFFYR